ncbi:MAG TPA: S-layer homology domain-containing protein [Microbacteriaceae bacterium]|nr:S-layer homology domain-containing protein [Microbacteriaceae bacterium]
MKLLSKLCVVAASVVVAAGLAAAPATAKTAPRQAFSDVPASSQFAAAIDWLAQKHITTGYADDTFRPTRTITREAMAAFLYRLDGSPAEAAPASAPFPDVPRDGHFAKEIAWLAGTHITTGFADGGFHPTAAITREAMAAFLYRYAAMKGTGDTASYQEPATSSFLDVAHSAQFSLEVSWLASTGITTGWQVGRGCEQFRPTASITREAMAAFLYRYATAGAKPGTAAPVTCDAPPAGEGSFSGDAGTLKVGTAVQPGTYVSSTPSSGPGCSWARLSAAGDDAADTLASDLGAPGSQVIVTIDPADAYFATSGCGTWKALTGPTAQKPLTTIPGDGGTYVVGWGVRPGTYASTTPASGPVCFYRRLSSADGSVAAILDDEVAVPGERVVVTIEPGDLYFHTEGCGTWQALG